MTRNQASKDLRRSPWEHTMFEALTLSRPQFPLLWGLDVSVGNVLAVQNLSLSHRSYIFK